MSIPPYHLFLCCISILHTTISYAQPSADRSNNIQLSLITELHTSGFMQFPVTPQVPIDIPSIKKRRGTSWGLEGEYLFNPTWSLAVGIAFSQVSFQHHSYDFLFGSSIANGGTSSGPPEPFNRIDVELSYWSVPLLVKYKLPQWPPLFFAYGIQFDRWRDLAYGGVIDLGNGQTRALLTDLSYQFKQHVLRNSFAIGLQKNIGSSINVSTAPFFKTSISKDQLHPWSRSTRRYTYGWILKLGIQL